MGPDVASEEQFGPYLVYERLGVGGMATVHRALERGVEGFERCVALKRLLPHLAEDASFIKAFVREAKLASMLAHVNIVQIYELGRVGTEYFISMEYIEGRDVRKILRHARKVTGPAPLHVTVGLMLQLLEALDYAHTKVDDQGQPLGLVHRDVSPSNLLVAPSGHLKVIDFGIAKAQSSTLRTQTGRVKGKLAYMAPEAISGSKDLDARSDVWACGVILHELLTARPLFASKNEYQTLMKVQRGDIMPPSTFNQACTPELDAIAFKALARDPDDRFTNALDMRDELTRVRKQYQLQTSHRDVAMWLDWAFSLEPPAGFSGNTFEPSGQMATPVGTFGRASTPRPLRNHDDDEAVEMVWGTGEAEDVGHSGPIVLDDVPDVSEKHLAVRPETFVTGDDVEVDVEVISSTGGVGDIPVHQPSHGTAPRGSRPSDRFRAPTPEVVPDFEMSRPRPRTSNPPPTGTARDSSLAMEDLFGLDDLDDHPPPIAVGRANTQEPVVRFSNTGQVAIQRVPTATGAPQDALDPLPPPARTRPGVQPAAGRKTAPVSIAPATQKPVIGASMVERNKTGRWWMVLGLLLLAGGGAGVAWYVTIQQPATAAPKPVAPVATGPATVNFDVTPADSEIRIDGTAHNGSPWSTELAAGVHQIEIHRSGYTAYLTSLELAASDKHSLHIELRPLGTTGATGEATLSVSSTPSGLEAELDGVMLPEHTPIKLPIKPGSHTIVLKNNGAEIWRQTVNAEASSDIELNPSFTAAAPPNVGGAQPIAQPASHTVKRTPTEQFVTDEPVARPDAAAAPQEQATPVPMPERPVVPAPPAPTMPAPTPIPPPPTPVMPTGPVTVAPNAVTKVSGESPNISRYKSQSLPAITAAKLCIDTSGNVASVDFVGKLDKRVASDLADQLKAWKYKPYVLRGTAIGACFVVTMRMK